MKTKKTFAVLTIPCFSHSLYNYQHVHWQTFKANMLSDPSVYPLVGIMGFALIFMAGMGTHALLTYQDVEIDPKKRASTLRYWGNDQKHEPLTKSLVYWNSWQKNYPEGLGIDHKKWLESKAKKE